MATSAAQTGYAPVDGLEMYYEIHGSGEPLLLLHGGMTTIETSFGTVLPVDTLAGRECEFATKNLVRRVDLGHPRSTYL